MNVFQKLDQIIEKLGPDETLSEIVRFLSLDQLENAVNFIVKNNEVIIPNPLENPGPENARRR